MGRGQVYPDLFSLAANASVDTIIRMPGNSTHNPDGFDFQLPSPSQPSPPCYTSNSPQEFKKPARQPTKRKLTVRERAITWFLRPLESLNRDDDVFACLMICLPLIEKWVRYRMRKARRDDQNEQFSENSFAIHEVAKVFGEQNRAGHEPDMQTVFEIWHSFRNGLLHRAAPKPVLDFELRPDRSGRPVFERDNQRVKIYPFLLRTKVIELLKDAPDELWQSDRVPFPEVWRIEA
jgi:hypothetical protein